MKLLRSFRDAVFGLVNELQSKTEIHATVETVASVAENVKVKSIRKSAILLGIVVFFYNMAWPLLSRQKSASSDIRVGVVM